MKQVFVDMTEVLASSNDKIIDYTSTNTIQLQSSKNAL